MVLLSSTSTTAQSQPPPNNRAKPQAGASNQEPAQPEQPPPINVTVTVPAATPNPEQTKREEAREERNVAAQEDIRDFTWALTIVAAVQIVLALVAIFVSIRQFVAMRRQGDYMRDGLAETRVAAEAAKKSADVADRALHLVHQQWLTTKNWRIFDVKLSDDVVMLDIAFEIHNPTGMGVTLDGYEISVQGAALSASRAEDIGQIVPPGESHIAGLTCQLNTPALIAALNDAELAFFVTGVMRFTDAFERERTQPFSMDCHGGRYIYAQPKWKVKPSNSLSGDVRVVSVEIHDTIRVSDTSNAEHDDDKS